MRKKIVVIGILCISVIIVLFLIFLKNRKIENPAIVELQKQITEQVGSEFQISKDDLYSKEPLAGLSIYANEEQFYQQDIFTKVNKIQEIVFDYVRKNENCFVMDHIRGETFNGFLLTVHNADELAIQSTVFSFSNYIENEKQFNEDYLSVYCNSGEWKWRDDVAYGYKISQIQELKNVKELKLIYFELDDLTVLKEMNHLKYFFADADKENYTDYDKLREDINQYGIQFIVW